MKIIIYVLDSLRADHLSCYGYDRNTSPKIDRLAAEGFIFENAFSVSTWTRASAASILTSTYPSVHHVMTNNDFLPSGLVTLPELLQKQEFKTIGITAMGNIASTYGFNSGFTKYYDLFRDKNLKEIRDKAEGKYFGKYEKAEDAINPLSEDVNQAALSMLKKYRKTDLFLLLWSIDTHLPFSPPRQYAQFVDPEYEGEVDGAFSTVSTALKTPDDLRHWIDLYDSEIYHNDHSIGQLVEGLKSLDLYEETTIFVMGDHGEGLGEHGALTHGGLPYDSVIRVPLIVKLGHPFSNPKTKEGRADNLVPLIDIFPTIAEMIGCRFDKIPAIQGRSFLPLLQGDIERYQDHEAVYAEQHQSRHAPYYRSIRTQEWKFIHCDYPLGLTKLSFKSPKRLVQALFKRFKWLRASSELLFNLKDDPSEIHNLENHPDLVKEFMNRLLKWQTDNERYGHCIGKGLAPAKNVEDDKLKKHLRGLGYLE